MKMAKLTLTQQLDEVSCRMKKIVAAASRLRAHFGDGPHCEALAEISGQAALADETITRTLASLATVAAALVTLERLAAHVRPTCTELYDEAVAALARVRSS